MFLERVEQDKLARQSLSLWSACQSLLTAVNAWSPDVPWSEQLKPLKSEVEAIVKAGGKIIHKESIFVCSILGVCFALKPRFLKFLK